MLNGIIFDSISKILSMKYLLILSLVLFTLGCKTAKQSANQTPEISRLKITAALGEINAPSDPIEITAVRIEGNTMFIDMNYTGGCEEHTFSVVGSEMISKSLPPIRSVQLIHSAKGDQCKKLVEETLIVDISKLAYKQENGSMIFLLVNDLKNRIEYTFE